jgi:hypothetical protein
MWTTHFHNNTFSNSLLTSSRSQTTSTEKPCSLSQPMTLFCRSLKRPLFCFTSTKIAIPCGINSNLSGIPLNQKGASFRAMPPNSRVREIRYCSIYFSIEKIYRISLNGYTVITDSAGKKCNEQHHKRDYPIFHIFSRACFRNSSSSSDFQVCGIIPC